MEKCARCAQKRPKSGPKCSPRNANRDEMGLLPANRCPNVHQRRDNALDGVLCRPSLGDIREHPLLGRLRA